MVTYEIQNRNTTHVNTNAIWNVFCVKLLLQVGLQIARMTRVISCAGENVRKLQTVWVHLQHDWRR